MSNTAKKIIATILVVMFACAAMPTLILFDIERTAFNPETYKKIIRDENIYDKTTNALAKFLVSEFKADDTNPPSVSRLSDDEMKELVQILFPQNAVTQMGFDSIDSIFDYINGKSNSAEISVEPWKTAVTSEENANALFELMNAQPPCTDEEIKIIKENDLEMSGPQLCKPPAGMQEQAKKANRVFLQSRIADLPNHTTIIQSNSQNDPRTRIMIIRLAMRFSVVVPIILLLLYTLVIVRSTVSWLKWWGIPFLNIGVPIFIIGSTANYNGACVYMVRSRSTCNPPKDNPLSRNPFHKSALRNHPLRAVLPLIQTCL